MEESEENSAELSVAAAATAVIAEDSAATVTRSPAKIELPVDQVVAAEVQRLAEDRNTRIDALSEPIKRDPVLSLELLKLANAMFYAQDRALISTVEKAVVRLGGENILRIVAELRKRPPLQGSELIAKFEELRADARETAEIAAFIARLRSKDLEEEARTIASMETVGHMLAVASLGQKYLELAKGASRLTLEYRLKSKCNFNIQSIHLSYLRTRGVPQNLLTALDKESTPKTSDDATRRFIVQAALEMLTVFKRGKSQRYIDPEEIPSNSSFRLLNLNTVQYKKVFAYCEENVAFVEESDDASVEAADLKEIEELILGISEEERADSQILNIEDLKAQLAQLDQQAAVKNAESVEVADSLKQELLEQELQTNLDTVEQAKAGDADYIKRAPETVKRGGTSFLKFDQKPFIEIDNQTSFAFTSIPYPAEPQYLVTQMDSKTAPPPFATNQGQQVVSGFMRMLAEAKNKEQLLENVLDRFIAEGIFLRAALIKVADDHRSAHIQIAVGDDLENGDPIEFMDPLTPLASCFTKVRSFNSKGTYDIVAPLGISAYAVSPLNTGADTPVLLYADCGTDRSMPFEVRRLFRYVVGLINYILPKLDGDLPQFPPSTSSH